MYFRSSHQMTRSAIEIIDKPMAKSQSKPKIQKVKGEVSPWASH